MKILELLSFLALLLLALDSCEASLLARGRIKTKKLQDQEKEAPYVCLDVPAKLPACNFGAVAESESLQKPMRQLRSLDTLSELDELSAIGESEGTQVRATTIIYKIEGCIPSRLPFDLPLCKEEDSDGRIVEVRRLFPFEVAGSWSENDGALPTLVFPKVDVNRWQRFMQGPWSRYTDDNDNTAQSDKVTRQITEEKQTEVTSKGTMKWKKSEESDINEKKKIQQGLTDEFLSKQVDENDIFSKFPSSNAVEQQLVNVRTRDTDSTYKTRSSRLNRIVDVSQDDGEVDHHVINKAFSSQHRHEFPYAKAIPYDASKLQVAKLGSEFPYPRAIPYDPEMLQVVRIGSEFPYNRAIFYNPMKLKVAGMKSEFPYKQPLSYDHENLGVTSIGSEFPYSRAIPFDPTKLLVSKRGSEFPYSRAIPFDPTKLLVSKRGSEFPYSRAIPFDPTKLSVSKRGSEFPYSRAIPFDPTKLLVSKRGSEFPYSRAIPFDPTKLLVSKRGSEFPYSRAIPFDPTKLLVSKRGSEFPYSRAIPFDPTKLLVSKRGSEFPYSRAIPFDPTKLLVSKRGSEFPYSRAISYDPKKLEERRSAGLANFESFPFSSPSLNIDDAHTKPQNPTVVPFDSSMIDAAKDGGIFPYGKKAPDDTSKIVHTVEFPRSSVPEKLQVPVRHVKSFLDQEFPTYTRKMTSRKEQMRLENARAGRELEENLISSWNGEIEPSTNHERFDASSHPRFTRSAMEANGSGDKFSGSESLEIPRRWSEFPYSKAIPFDSEKLTRTRLPM